MSSQSWHVAHGLWNSAFAAKLKYNYKHFNLEEYILSLVFSVPRHVSMANTFTVRVCKAMFISAVKETLFRTHG